MKSSGISIFSVVTISVLYSCMCLAVDHESLSYNTEELSITVDRFDLVGDLYTPSSGARHPAIIFVAGDDPSGRESTIPMLQTYGYFDLFLGSGFALLVYDKPGFGESHGELSRENLFNERAQIVSKWVDRLSQHPSVHPRWIGLAGGSQAGYVMPLVYDMKTNIAFLFCQSCPAMNSIDQSAFLIREQTLCAGLTSDVADRAHDCYIRSCTADDYPEYLEAAAYLAANPVVKTLGWDHIQTEEEFQPSDSSSESFFDPAPIVRNYDIPFLALFGEKDRLIDPYQGYTAYQAALSGSSSKQSQVHILPDVDHSLSLAETGCLDELMKKRSVNRIVLSDKAQEIVSEYLVGLRQYLRN